MQRMEQHTRPREPRLRDILAARGIESSAERARRDYLLRKCREAIEAVEVVELVTEVIELG